VDLDLLHNPPSLTEEHHDDRVDLRKSDLLDLGLCKLQKADGTMDLSHVDNDKLKEPK
jgi:hypothetical protein